MGKPFTVYISGTTHIIGKCIDCQKEHDGLFAVSIHHECFQAGIYQGDCFHPLESIRIPELFEMIRKADEEQR